MAERRFSVVGHCIYCGSTDQLSDEHIIPFSLNGTSVLPKASCRNCADITKKFEQTCARTIFGNFRNRNNAATRKPKRRPTHIPVNVRLPSGEIGKRMVPASEHPGPFSLLTWGPPGILIGKKPEDEDNRIAKLWAFKGFVDEFNAANPDVYSFDMSFNQHAFCRLLAKIGYGMAVAHSGDEFRPLVIDLILGRVDNDFYLVGGDMHEGQRNPEAIHTVETKWWTDIKTGREFLLAHIRLFAFLSSPTYHVVVGEKIAA